MKKIICNIIILICCFWGISCTEENDLLEENVNALLETRSVPVIVTECRDAYVDVGNVVVYKGTTCQSYYVGGGGPPPGGGYSPGGFPEYGTAKDEGSRGGSGFHQYYVGDKWIFEFPDISCIYHQLSTLDVVQKARLEKVMETFAYMPSDYTKLLNKLVNKNIKIKFSVDENSPYPAFFKTGTNEIVFNNTSTILWEYFIEELVHAVQYDIYGDTMISAIKNFEFEAQAFIDIVNVVSDRYDENSDVVRFIPTQHDPNSVFNKDYREWIESLRNRGYLSSNDYFIYFDLCDLWSGAPGVCNPGLEPQLLHEFFRKPRPPKY